MRNLRPTLEIDVCWDHYGRIQLKKMRVLWVIEGEEFAYRCFYDVTARQSRKIEPFFPENVSFPYTHIILKECFFLTCNFLYRRKVLGTPHCFFLKNDIDFQSKKINENHAKSWLIRLENIFKHHRIVFFSTNDSSKWRERDKVLRGHTKSPEVKNPKQRSNFGLW